MKRMIAALMILAMVSMPYNLIISAEEKTELVHQILMYSFDNEDGAVVKVEGDLPEGVELAVQEEECIAEKRNQEGELECYKITLELDGKEYEPAAEHNSVTVSISANEMEETETSAVVYTENGADAQEIAYAKDLSEDNIVYESEDLSESIVLLSLPVVALEATIYSWGEYPHEDETGRFTLHYNNGSSAQKLITDDSNGINMEAIHWKCAILENKIETGQFDYVCFDVSMDSSSTYGQVHSAIVYLLDDYTVQLGSSWDICNRYISETKDTLLASDACLAYSNIGLDECDNMKDGSYTARGYEGVIRLAIPEDTEDFYIALQNCDTEFTIHAIWLENEQNQKSNYILDGDKYQNSSDYGVFEFYHGQNSSDRNISRLADGITMQRYNYKAICSSKKISLGEADKICIRYALEVSEYPNYCVGRVSLLEENTIGALPNSSNAYNKYLTGKRYCTYDICVPSNPQSSSGVLELEIPKGVDSFYLGIENCDTILRIESVWFETKDPVEKIISEEFFDLVRELGGSGKAWKGGNISLEEIQEMRSVLRKYHITSEESIQFFLATCFTESAYGTVVTEMPNEEEAFAEYAEQAGLKYTYSERGAGYIQVTNKGNQEAFLLYDTGSNAKAQALQGEIDAGNPNARVSYIATECPLHSAAWYWSIMPRTSKENINNYVNVFANDSNEELIYLITQYFVNGTVGNVLDGLSYAKNQLLEGKVVYSITSESVTIENYGTYKLPNGWSSRAENLALINAVLEEMER